MKIVQQLLNLLLARRYEFTDHATDRMDDADLSLHDVFSCFATGRLRRTWPRQKKYEIEGIATDGRLIRVIARLIGPRRVRIITVYEVH